LMDGLKLKFPVVWVTLLLGVNPFLTLSRTISFRLLFASSS